MRASSVVLLPHAPSSVAVARKRLSSDLRAAGVRDTVVDDAGVVISELLSNALRHARPLPAGQVRVVWTRDADRIELAVSDGGATTEPRRGRPALSSLGGRGLGIVEALSERWGVRHEEAGTTVWAVLRATPAGTPVGGLGDRGLAIQVALRDLDETDQSAAGHSGGRYRGPVLGRTYLR